MTVRGGLVMIPIVLCGAMTVAIIIEKFFSLKNAEIDTEKFLDELEKILKRRKIKEALELCDRYSQPIPRIIKAGLLKSDRSREEIKETIEDAYKNASPGDMVILCPGATSFNMFANEFDRGRQYVDNVNDLE